MNQIVAINKAELLEAIRRDCVSFFAFYLQEKLTLDVPEFHIEIWDELLELLDKVNQPDLIAEHLQKLFAVPREHSKSTIAKLSVILFMRYSRLNFTLYASLTGSIAVNACKDIIAWFTSPQEVELYGEPIQIQSNESKSIWIYLIGIPGQAEKKRITLKGIGSDQQVRGMLIDSERPQLVIIDDIEDYSTADGDIQQKKLDTWFFGSLLKATARVSVRIFIGNMVKSTTLLARLAKDNSWNPTVFGALVRDKETGVLRALWEGRWTVQALLADYRTYRKNGVGHVWETEMMNLAGDKLLQQSLANAIMVTDVHPEEITCGFICLDPAFGQESWHDESAITVHVRKPGVAIPILADSIVGRWKEDRVFDELIAKSFYWNLSTWVIESVAAQRLFIPYFRLLIIDRGYQPDAITMLPILAGKESKASRILNFRQSVAGGSYAYSDSQIDAKLRLEEYTPDTKDHDDLCDSSAFGPLVWSMYGTVVEANGVQSVLGRLMQQKDFYEQNRNAGERDVAIY